MPLPKPSLDSRRFDQLVNEGRALIPRLAPEWTDHNASDPGITLLELGAWLTEQNIFRFDRLSESAMRAFVRLVGVEPMMPTIAKTVVAIVNANATNVSLPERMQVATPRSALFETVQPVFASSAQLIRVLTGRGDLLDVTAANSANAEFPPYGTKPRAGNALYIGFDRALDAPGATHSLYIWTPHWRADARIAERLQSESAAAAQRCPSGWDWTSHYRVRTVWEFQTAGAKWQPLPDVVDETRALTLSGFVRFRAPVNHQPIAPGEPFLIRCRIARGRFECTPMVSHVAFNAVEVEHALSVPEREIGSARGHAAAVFSLGSAPVVASSVHLRLDDGAGDTQDDWHEAPDFERAGPHDRVFVLDPERGEIKSGDGLRAAVLPAGFTLFASYRLGGGTAGNVAAQTLTQIPASAANVALAPALSSLALPLSIDQPFDAAGGAPREMLASAQSRAFDIVNEVDKAVTLDDIERLALDTPGVPVARARAVANHAAELPCYPAAGVTTLIVIPPCSPPAPMPSRALLDAVEDYLQPRRLVTSEIHAIAPSYRRISVAAVVHLACEADAAKTLQRAQAALDRFLDPLRGGPANTGWEFGRTVYRSEVFALLAAVDGVVRITELTLIDGFPSTSATKSCGCVGAKASSGHCDNIDLCVHELVRPGRHRLTIQSAIPQNLVRSDAHECGST